ncbi:hypothetical protein U27_00622 [Candidatus Vecturithrix granuli]|uniref:Uncharacterized protein n=1 Tax=Vecturithrix granuli TaxID=1499967 RepID=A0A081C819_VECG1|nr:hypothetical protein U27_00622 [Candidatus Vecturithrix granuli]
MMRVEISIKMERLAELIARSPNRLEDIRDLCLELATDIDQHLQEVEEEHYEEEEEEYEEEEYEIEEDERYQEYQYRYGEDDE